MDEEQRLAAQRRMLAEKFGLRDSDDEDSQSDLSEQAETEDPVPAKPTDDSGDVVQVATSVKANEQNGASGKGDQNVSLWPGMRLSCPMNAKRLPSEYRYDPTEHTEATAKRECRITPITKYQSLYQESVGRRIAGADKFVAYAVGGHIRIIGRGSQRNILLKGHGSSVCDLEFAWMEASEGDATDEDGLHTTVIASVAEDGSVFIWKLMRDDDPDEEDAEYGEDGQVQPVLAKLDSLKLQHPTEGQCYQRVSFRPVEGAVLSETGMGIAILLLDTSSPELRVTELVKMGDKSKVLDRFISGGHTSTHGDGLSAAAWLAKDLIATARGHEVCISSLADPKDIKKTATLDRPKDSMVSSLHLVQRGKGFSILLVAAENGSVLEIWSIMPNKKPVIVQRLLLDPKGSGDSFHVVAHDAKVREYIAVSSLHRKAVFVLHFRPDRACLDAITQLPVKQAVLSLCMTQNMRKIISDNAHGLPEASEALELGLWCVMPNTIHMMHALAADCAPKEGSKLLEACHESATAASATEIAQSASSNGSSRKPASAVVSSAPVAENSVAAPMKPVVSDESPIADRPSPATIGGGISAASKQSVPAAEATSAPAAPAAAPRGAAKAVTLLKKPTPSATSTVAAGNTAATASSSVASAATKDRNFESSTSITVDSDPGSAAGVVAARSAQWEAKSKGDRPDAPGSPDASASSKRSPIASERGATESSATLVTATTGAPSDVAGVESPAPGPSVDEIVATVSAAAHKVAADFDEEGVKREAAEKAKIPKLVAKVRQLAEGSMETLVAQALKKPMADAIIPAVSEIVTQSSEALARASSRADALSSDSKERQIAASQMTPQWFAQSFRDAGIASSFASACTEMERQALGAVKESMAQKHKALVSPAVTAVETATSDLTAASQAFTESVQDSMAKTRALHAGAGKGAEEKEEDVMDRVAALMAESEVVEALSVAVASADPKVVLHVVEQIDATEFFENEILSQSSTLALIKMLGRKLGESTTVKVQWLKELLLVLEPHDEEIVATAPPTLQQLMGNTEMLKRDKERMAANPALAKDVKMLSLLIASQDG